MAKISAPTFRMRRSPSFRPPLLHSVKLEAKLMFLEENDNVDDLDGGAENWEVVGVADKRIGSFIFTIE